VFIYSQLVALGICKGTYVRFSSKIRWRALG